MTTNTYVAANKDGTYKVVTDHAFHPIAAKILQQQRNPNDAFEHLITASSAHLKTMMSLHQEDSANKDLRDYKLGGTMVAFVDGSPRIWSYLIEVVDWGKGPGKPQILDRSRLFEPYEVLALGEVSPKSMSFPIPYKDYRGGSIKLLLNQLEIQSKLTPDSVGRPFTVVKLKQDGSEFAIGGSVCHDEWQAVHR